MHSRISISAVDRAPDPLPEAPRTIRGAAVGLHLFSREFARSADSFHLLPGFPFRGLLEMAAESPRAYRRRPHTHKAASLWARLLAKSRPYVQPVHHSVDRRLRYAQLCVFRFSHSFSAVFHQSGRARPCRVQGGLACNLA